MTDERELVSLEVAIGMLPNRAAVHTFRNAHIAIVGADWERESLIEAMRAAPFIEIAGPGAQALGHGLAITDKHGLLFIETQKPEPEKKP